MSDRANNEVRATRTDKVIEEWIDSWPDWEREAAVAILRRDLTRISDCAAEDDLA